MIAAGSARTSSVFLLFVAVAEMTTITSLRGRTEVVHPRRTEAHDASAFASLFTHFTEDIFGRIDVAYLL